MSDHILRIRINAVAAMMSCLVGAAIATLGGAYPAAVMAQAGDSAQGLEEVVVTARRREETLQETPVSIAALSAAELDVRNVTNLLHVNTLVPNLVISGKGPGGGTQEGQFSIRGIGSSRGTIQDENRVPVYLDGVYLGTADGALVDVINVERIEVLRGPQGTLFGKNALSGAIHYISQEPGEEFGGRVKVGGGRFGRHEVSGHVDVPFGTNVFSRLSGAYRNDDGNGESVTTGEDLGDVGTTFFSGDFVWEAADNFRVRLAGDYTDEDNNGPVVEIIADDVDDPNDPVYFNTGIAPLLVTTYNQLANFFPTVPRLTDTTVQGVDRWDTRAGTDGVAKTETWGVRLNLDWEITSWLTVKSLTSYRELSFDRVLDLDATQHEVFEELHNRDYEQIQQEIQFHGVNFSDRLTWVLGVFYLNSRNEFARVRNVGCELGVLPSPPAPAVVRRFVCPGAQSFETIDVESVAVYGEATYGINEIFSLTGGLRWTSEDTEDFGSQIRPPPYIEGSNSGNNTKVTPRVILRAEWTEDLMTYFSYSEGFRSGGHNARVITTLPDNGFLPFEPETLTAYEIGVKSQFFDDRLQVNIAGFIQDWDDMQVEQNLTLPPTFIPQNFFQNAGSGKSDGFEMEVVALLGAGWRFNAGLGYIDAGYTELDPAIVSLTLDTPFAEAPEWNYNLGAQWDYQPSFGGALTTRVDWGWQDDQQVNADRSNAVRDNSFGLLRANMTYELPGGRWTVSVFGTNLTNERYLLSGLSGVGQTLPTGTYGRQREWGVSVTYEF
jgi:iron complex outermembrane receptor protein